MSPCLPLSPSPSLLLACLAALAFGCASARDSTPNAEGDNGIFHRATAHHVSSREYRVDAADEIIIRSPSIKALDGQHQRVRSDGKITLNFVDEIYVAGMTPGEINAMLRKLLEKYFTSPDVKVEVIANSKFYYVFGFGAQQQGKFPYTGRDTVVSALAEAGFNEGAWPQQVRVSRPGKDGRENATAVVDFKRVWGYGDLSQNYLLEEGDIVEVPHSPLKAWDEKTRRILGPIAGSTALATTGGSVVRAGPAGQP